MTIRRHFRRILSLLLLLSMVLSLFPVGVTATEPLEEEKATTKAGKNYTSTINALEKPVAAYSIHEDVSALGSSPDTFVGTGTYAMVVKVGSEYYAFNPSNLKKATYSATVGSTPVTMDDGSLYFASEAEARASTITFIKNASYTKERIFNRNDGLTIQATAKDGAPGFWVYANESGSFGFYNTAGQDGLVIYKYIDVGTRTRYVISYGSGSFSFVEYTANYRNENTTFYFYQLVSITENLYNAIQNAKAYATGNTNGTYDPELYDGFIRMLEECIEVYTSYNRYLPKAERGHMVAYRNALNSRADSLNAYMAYLDAAGSSPNYDSLLSKLPASKGWGNYVLDFADRASPAVYTGLDGTYYIVVYSNSTNYVIDPTATGKYGYLGVKPATVVNGSITKIDGVKPTDLRHAIDMVYEEHPTETNNNCYYLCTQDGSFLQADAVNGEPVLTLGKAHQPFGIRYVSGNTSRIFFNRKISTTTAGVALGNNSIDVRLNFANATDGVTFMRQNQQDNSNYRMFRLTWSTEDLLDALEQLAEYYDSYGSSTVSGVTEEFLKCYDESVALYFMYNVSNTAEQLEETTAIQAELKAQVTRLWSYASILGNSTYADVLSNLDTPYNERSNAPLSRFHAMNIRYMAGGYYYFVMENAGNRVTSGYAWAIDNYLYDQNKNNRITAAPATIEDGRVVNAVPTWAINIQENWYADTLYAYEFSTVPAYNIEFYVNAGTFLDNNEGPKAIGFGSGSQVAFEIATYNDGFTMKCNKNFDGVSGNEPYYVQYVPELGGFRPFAPTAITGETTRFHLYRISSQVMDLYNALVRMEVYAGGNADGRYPADKYAQFIACLQESLALYQYYNTPLHEDWNEEALKAQLDAQAETLLGYIDILTLSDTKVSYIDIPVEILDFRADGFMFEYNNNTFGLSAASAVAKHYGFKESYLKAASTGKVSLGAGSVAQKLTEPTLVGGKMVYTEKTLRQVAYTILAGIATQYENIPGQNNTIKAKADSLATEASKYTVESSQWNAVLGSASATFKKTSTEKNGGELAWIDVTTGYDLAYYILNYLWRPVSTKDDLGDGYTYNVSVPERAVFRMFQDENGRYTLNSYNWVEYTDAYSYNAYPLTETDVYRDSPNFTPINGLGFEKPGYMANDADTDRSEFLADNNNYDTRGTNFHFTVHAKGSFVYYEEQELYFEFLGDDDVYFYINGELVMDLGGGHSAAGEILYLNSIAASHGLKDGEVYSFDMFYAERHTSASNLKFSTNMQLMDPDLITKKNQYDATTGSPIMDGAAVNVGTPVSYSFEMENHGDLPVVDLTFSDPTLGIYMSKDKVTIDPALSSTKVTDITLTYRSFDRKTGELFVGNISYHKDYKYFKNKLTGHVNDTSNPQPHKGQYTYTVKSADELKAILEIGIPANFLLTISGMVRNTTEGKYVNTVTTSAHPVTLDASGGIIPLSPVYANASRNIYGIDLTDIRIPEALQIVLDYGKPLALPLHTLQTRVELRNSNMVMDYAGLSLNGENGVIRVKQPNNLFCIGDVKSMEVSSGTFTLEGSTPVFRLKEMMTHEEIVYAVYRLSLRDTGAIIGYVMEEVQLLPATMMYYETDFAEGIFTMESGSATTVGTAQTEYQDDGSVVPGEAFVKTVGEEKEKTHSLFFDFRNTSVDQDRYTASQYAGKNYDTMDSWKLDHSSTAIDNGVIDNQAGTLTFSPIKTFQVDANGSSTANRLDLCNKDDLAYDPSRAEILQVRFKLENMSAGNSAPFFRLWWWGKKGDKTYHGYELAQFLSASYSSNDTYLVFSLDLRSINDESYTNSGSSSGFIDLRELDVLTDFRFSLHNFAVSPSSKITYDYLYIGPKNNAPVQHPEDSLYITFDNMVGDQYRYCYPQYNGLNPDTGKWSAHHYIKDAGTTKSRTPVIDNISGTISATPYQAVETGKGNNISFMFAGLNYPTDKAEVFQVRAKLVNMTYHSNNNIDFRYKTAANESSYVAYPVEYKPTSEEVISNGFVTYRILLGDDFRSIGTLTALRATFETFGVTMDSRVIVDYIYVGPLVDAPPMSAAYHSAPKDNFLYFGYENDADAQARYRSTVYNALNFDTMEDPTTGVTCWSGNKADLTMDNTTGTLSVSPTVDPSTIDRFYIQTGVNGGHTQPINFSPESSQIVQVRLKFQGFSTRQGSEKVPTLRFRAHKDGYVYDENVENCTVFLGSAIPIDVRYMDANRYITYSTPVVSSVSEYATLHTIRLDFQNFGLATDGVNGIVTIDYIYVGPADSAPKTVYGYDSSYEDDRTYSNGSSMYIQGNGVYLEEYPDTPYTRTEFSFTGTGFDVIATTGDQTATLRMELRDEKGALLKRMTVNTKGELELYQIPVISVQGLTYGNYRVTIDVNKAVDSILPMLTRGNKFYFDAVRIYDPMDTTKAEPSYGEMEDMIAHLMDREDRSQVKEIRNILLSATDYDILTADSKQTGALFLDSYLKPTEPVVDPETGKPTTATPDDLDITNHYTMDILTYNKVGPKNEVYLDPSQAVAFKLELDSIDRGINPWLPISLDVGAKVITSSGKSATLVAAVVSHYTGGKGTTASALTIATSTTTTLSTCTAMYRPLTVTRDMLRQENDKYYCYVVLYNASDVADEGATGERNGDYVISLTDVKLCYTLDPSIVVEDAPTDPEIKPTAKAPLTAEEVAHVNFVVDKDTTKAAALVMKAHLETPLLKEGTKLMHSLDLASDIAINYAVKKTDVEGYDSFYLECLVEGREEAQRIDPVEKGEYYYFTLEGLTAVQMTDTVTATLYMKKDGRTYYTEADTYSVAQYAYSQLSKTGAKAELKTLCAELLRYGTMAQLYKCYRTHSLANGNMTQAQAALLTDLDSVPFGTNNRVQSQLTAPKVTWAGKALVLDTKVTVRYIVDIADATLKAEDLTLRVRYTDYAGNEKEVILANAQPYGDKEGRYSFDFDSLLAAELRTVLYGAVYAEDTQVSDTLIYSADSYGSNRTGALGNLCRALIAYSDSAKAFFG